MKATCLKENLHRSMNITGGAIAAKAPMPILQNVLIQAHEGKLTFSGTNLETTITTSAEAQVEEPGAAAVPARLFSEFIGTLPDGPVELAIAEGAGMLRVTAGKTNTNINAANPQDFPPIPTAGTRRRPPPCRRRRSGTASSRWSSPQRTRRSARCSPGST